MTLLMWPKREILMKGFISFVVKYHVAKYWLSNTKKETVAHISPTITKIASTVQTPLYYPPKVEV